MAITALSLIGTPGQPYNFGDAPVQATAYTFTGPISGVVNIASSNFTVTPNGDADGIEVTPATDGSGTFTPASVTFTGSNPATFTYTPTDTAGSPHALSVTDDGWLTDPANIDYTVNETPTPGEDPTGGLAFHFLHAVV